MGRSLKRLSLTDRMKVIRTLFPDSQGADLEARLQVLEQAILANEEEGKAEREQSFQHFLERQSRLLPSHDLQPEPDETLL